MHNQNGEHVRKIIIRLNQYGIGDSIQYTRLLIDRKINGCVPDGHPCHDLLPIDINEENLKVEITQCSALSKGAGYSMIRITDIDGKHADKLKEGMTSNLYGECEILKISPKQYLAMVSNNNCMLATILTESGCFLTSAIPFTDDIIEWGVLSLNSTYVDRMMERMRQEGYKVKMISTNKINKESILTEKQEDALMAAYKLGYYSVPRKITIDELSNSLNYSKSTLSVMLREAEKKLVFNYLNLGMSTFKKK